MTRTRAKFSNLRTTRSKPSSLKRKSQLQTTSVVITVLGVTAVGIFLLRGTFAASSKIFAPGADPNNFPKLSTSLGAAGTKHAPVKDDSEDTVYAIEKTSSTDGIVAAYDAAPGENKHTLYQKLRAQGVKGLIDPDMQVSEAYSLVDPGGSGGSNCWTDGTARGECWAWKNLGHDHPQIYFIDHTGSQWPVSAATYKWNQAHGIDSWYRWGSCPSLSGIHCVPVNSGNYGATGWDGLTLMYNSGSIMTSASIQLNQNYIGAYASVTRPHVYAMLACHEEGHALGLNHNTSSGSCMFKGDPEFGATVPSSQDFSLLSAIYSVKR